jgi:hypothetical protein
MLPIFTHVHDLLLYHLLYHTHFEWVKKEDIIVRVRLGPSSMYSGIREGFFENLAVVFRDQHTPIFQMLVLLENAQTYPASLPLPLAKIIFKFGALIGQLLGYKIEYKEYTTIADELNW